MNEKDKELYELLNIPETASREEIDAAYAARMERFSEDNYLGSPLWDMAAQKRQNLREAYTKLTGADEPAAVSPEPAKAEISLNKTIRGLLNENKPEEAEALLNRQPDRDTNPEWVYLRGMAAWKRGWTDEAYQLLKRASKLAPKNAEYQKSYEKLLGSPAAALRFRTGEGVRLREVCTEGCGECCCEGLCEGICSAF